MNRILEKNMRDHRVRGVYIIDMTTIESSPASGDDAVQGHVTHNV